jgi:hypothetical protein
MGGILTRGNGQQKDTAGEEETQWIGEKYNQDNIVSPAPLF